MDAMDVYRISYYDAFVCAGGACTESCCRGWGILVEDEAWERFRAERNLFGIRLRLSVRGKEERLLNRNRLRCPFLERSGLCAMQRKRGHDFLPLTCRQYPRKHHHLGIRAEEYLDLSCVEAARLFLSEQRMPQLMHTQEEVGYKRSGSNADFEDLQSILSSRELLLRRLSACEKEGEEAYWEAGFAALGEAFGEMLADAARWQENCARGDAMLAPKDAEDEKPEKALCFPLPLGMLNEWMNACLYQEGLKERLPFLERILRMYFKRFDDLTEESGTLRLTELFRRFREKRIAPVNQYIYYCATCLYRFYTDAFEDYSFLKHVRRAVMHTNMLYLLDALYADETGGLSVPEAAHILAVYEKRVFHSTDTERKMLLKWQERERELVYG